MFLLYLIFSFVHPDNNWKLEDPDLFRGVFVVQIGLNDDGIFILNSSEYHVQHYNYSGKRLKTFARRGDGPGEFREPYILQVLDNEVIVYELDRVHVFNNNGELLFTRKFPVGNSLFKRVINGWVSIENLLNAHTDKPIGIYFHKGSTKKLICEIKRIQAVDNKMFNADNTIPYNPVVDHGDFIVDLTGHFVFIRIPGSTNVFVVDSKIEDISFNFEIPGRPVKFNSDWGNMRLDSMNKVAKHKYVANFPDFFPVVAGMTITVYNELNVLKYTWVPYSARGESNFEILPLTLSAQERNIKENDNVLFMHRVVGIHDKYIYWIAYDDEADSYTIKRIEQTQFNQNILMEGRLPIFCPTDLN